jgi:hypothetical protein
LRASRASGGVFLLSSFVRLCFTVVDSQKQNGALLIAACIIAAVRLRGEPIQPSPKLKFVVSESVQLAKLVLQELNLNH